MLREVTAKIGLERIDIQKGVVVEVLLDSGVMGLVMSLEFAKKQGFKLTLAQNNPDNLYAAISIPIPIELHNRVAQNDVIYRTPSPVT